MALPYWTAGRVIGLVLIVAGIGLFVAEIVEPSASAAASLAVSASSNAWGQIYDQQMAHLQELGDAAGRFVLLGAVMIWFPRRWLRWRPTARVPPAP